MLDVKNMEPEELITHMVVTAKIQAFLETLTPVEKDCFVKLMQVFVHDCEREMKKEQYE